MNKLKFWRIERSLSQRELAQASGVPRWSIQLIESGFREPSLEELNALASTLGIEASIFESNLDSNRLKEKEL